MFKVVCCRFVVWGGKGRLNLTNLGVWYNPGTFSFPGEWEKRGDFRISPSIIIGAESKFKPHEYIFWCL